jgi:ABC-2 type transport system ATP-binding protein
MSKTIVSVKGLSYAYNDLKAVNDVSLSVDAGEILGLLGPNGAGKTTIIKVLTGQLELQKGKVEFFGKSFKKNDTEIRKRIGVCFEEKNLYDNMSAKENIVFFAKLFGIENYDVRKALKRVNLANRMNDRVGNFSKGMRQKLMIARSLINTPDILFLDEPTSGLDPNSSLTIRKIIKEEAKRGAAIFLTTHDMHEADQLSDYVAFMNEGEIVAMDTPENLKVKHGKKSIKVRVRKDGAIKTEIISLEEKGVGEKVKKLVESKRLLTIHTEESNLESIFIKLTGRRLE